MKLIKALTQYENAPCIMAVIFLGINEYHDTAIFYPLAVASLLTYFATKAICEAIRNEQKS